MAEHFAKRTQLAAPARTMSARWDAKGCACLQSVRRMIYTCNVYQEVPMQVSKWGNSLAVRLPRGVVEALKLKEGDDIEIVVAGRRRFEIARDRNRAQALARLRALKRPLPKGF